MVYPPEGRDGEFFYLSAIHVHKEGPWTRICARVIKGLHGHMEKHCHMFFFTHPLNIPGMYLIGEYGEGYLFSK